MNYLYDILENESNEKAFHIYALVAIKMTKKVYDRLPEKIQQIADDAKVYWAHNEDRLLTRKKWMTTHQLFRNCVLIRPISMK